MNSSLANNKPLISVVIPTHKRNHLIPQTIASVLWQTYENIEVIVVNDYPTDESRSTLEPLCSVDPRVKLVHNPKNMWVSYTRNRWISLAAGKEVAFVDDDDIRIDPYKLEEQHEHLQRDPNIAVIGTQVALIDKDGNALPSQTYSQFPLTDAELRNIANYRMWMQQSAMVARKEALYKVWMYNNNLCYWEDYELLLKLGTVWKYANTETTSTLYRVHEGLCSQYWPESASRVLRILFDVWAIHPHYTKAIIHRIYNLWRAKTYGKIRPYLSDETVASAKKVRDALRSMFTNQ